MTDSQLEATLQHLRSGEIEITGQFAYGSNYTFLATVEWQGQRMKAVYKPKQGERPLWDFPQGTLAAREVAAFEVDRSLGWNFVPPTVMREEGPSGGGSLQMFVELNGARHYFELTSKERARLRPVALFDALVNNADRKGGHVLLAPEGKIWLIDHGICFHHEAKLRTVIWDFAGEPIPKELLKALRQFQDRLLEATDGLRRRLGSLLSDREVRALKHRAEQLMDRGTFPEPHGRRAHPWPLV